MPEDTKPAPKSTEAEQRAVAVKAYYDGTTKEEKAAAVKKYPILSTIFSEANHN